MITQCDPKGLGAVACQDDFVDTVKRFLLPRGSFNWVPLRKAEVSEVVFGACQLRQIGSSLQGCGAIGTFSEARRKPSVSDGAFHVDLGRRKLLPSPKVSTNWHFFLRPAGNQLSPRVPFSARQLCRIGSSFREWVKYGTFSVSRRIPSVSEGASVPRQKALSVAFGSFR